MRRQSLPRNVRAFTLVETLVGAAIGSMIMVALMIGFVALSKTFKATEDYSDGVIDQARILDYIARDVRRATTVAVTANPTRLTLTIPDQYANASPSRTFRTPAVGTAGVVYGSGTASVAYFLSGSNFVRQEGGADQTIATNVSDFTPAFDLSDSTGKTVKTTITFAPMFRRSVSADSRAGTSVTNRAFLRNK